MRRAGEGYTCQDRMTKPSTEETSGGEVLRPRRAVQRASGSAALAAQAPATGAPGKPGSPHPTPTQTQPQAPGQAPAGRGVHATMAGPTQDKTVATHVAWVGGMQSGYAFSEGAHHDALGQLICPAQGLVSVWRVGTVPSKLLSKARPWVLVKGPGCHVVKTWPDGPPAEGQVKKATRQPSGAPGSGGVGVVPGDEPASSQGQVFDERTIAEGLGIVVPTARWVPLKHRWMDLWIETVAQAIAVPLLMVGLATLVTLSSVLASKYVVHMTIYVDDGRGGKRRAVKWEEGCVLFGLIVAPSGIRKSPVLNAMLKPLRRSEEAALRSHREVVARWRNRVEAAQRKLDKMRGGKSPPGDEDPELVKAQIAAEEPEPPEPGGVVANASGPAVAVEMAKQASVFVATAEGSEIFSPLMQDDKAHVEPYLKGYSCEFQGKVLRISRKQPHGAASRLSVLGLTQPDGLNGLGEFLGPKGQGLFARFLWVGVDRNIESKGVIDEAMEQAWEARLMGLQRLPGPVRDSWGAENGAPTVIIMTPEQTAKVLAFEAELQRRMEPGGDLYNVDTWARKAHGQVCRIAAVLTCMDIGLPGSTHKPGQSIVIEDWALDWALDFVANTLIAHAQYAATVLAWPDGTDGAIHLMAVVTRLQTEPDPTDTSGKRKRAKQGARNTWTINEIDRWVNDWPTEKTDRALATLCDRGFASVSGIRGPRSERVVTFRRLS